MSQQLLPSSHEIVFCSDEHKQRFLDEMKRIGKIYPEDGKFDVEYASALYILTSYHGFWNKVCEHVSRYGINFGRILSEVDLSGGYSVLVQLAGNLFYQPIRVEPLDFSTRLDDVNFEIALMAIRLRRYGFRMEGK